MDARGWEVRLTALGPMVGEGQVDRQVLDADRRLCMNMIMPTGHIGFSLGWVSERQNEIDRLSLLVLG